MTKDRITQQVVNFIREDLVPREVTLEIDETTPLLRLGILNSLKTAILMNYLRDELNIALPVDQLRAEHFETVASIVTLIEDVVTRPSQ